MTKKNLSKILRMNQMALNMIRFTIILILQHLLFWQKKLYETKDKNNNNELVELIRVRWSNLKNVIEKMSKDEIKTEKPDKILEIVKEILDFNKTI